ncbi:transposase [Pontibacter sp. 172403-2]|uniref:RNA-guided endonuclease InsQ/TnpB family protein n=1 Tax=Pontibacter rufus TaxID=2791028 RepID=UPI0018B014A0|nr:RNA-guided endonuclease TnpB family protein [Pontibacter sp. 172403-2]MBF9253001.1 transposase [Pontibacter sp. 172403-2]
MSSIKTYRFKLKPTKEQVLVFQRWIGACRYVYNLALETKEYAYRVHRISLSKYDLCKQLTELKKDTLWIAETSSLALEDAVHRLDFAYQTFYRGGGYPKFASKRFYRSFTVRQNIKVCDKTCTIRLPKIGKVKFRKSQSVVGKLKTATIAHCTDGWYLTLTSEIDIEKLPTLNTSIGIDLGIKSFLVTSENQIVENPKNLYRYKRELNKAHRAVNRKKKGSSNRKKAVAKLAKVYLKVSNTRNDFQHKLSSNLIRENQTIVVENLRVSNMLKNHNLAKSIADASWRQFVRMLEYKAKWYGRELIKVNPQCTSQDCSTCGARNAELRLATREWKCEHCGTFHDRDVNAAINIKNKAVGYTVSASEIYGSTGRVAEEYASNQNNTTGLV